MVFANLAYNSSQNLASQMKSNNRSNNGPANGPSAAGPNAAPVSSATGLKVSAILRCFAAIRTYQKTFLLDPSHLCFDLLFFPKG